MVKNILKISTILVSALTLLVGVMIGTGAANAWMVGAKDGSDTQVSGCVIRFSNADGTPSIHANGAHMCAGVESVDINQHGEVRVWQTIKDPGNNPILFAQCQTDETLGGSRGITCGASGGTDNTRFRLYDSELGRALDLTQQSDRNRVQGKNSNLWVGWFHTKW